jgi:signal transduction histidine kinase
MLLDGYAGELTDKQRDFLKIASDTNEHQINIVNNLLGVAQLESGKIQLTMTQVDLVALARTLVEEYAPRARNKDQILSFSSRFKRLYCRADEHSLRTVLENILDNAFKYTMPGKAITLRLTKEANTAVISVVDQGVGIASNDLAKLFKKFSRIENPETFHEEGAGLGLYWAEKIIALHGGRIAIESEPGRGTHVKVILPMRRQAKKTRARPRRQAAAVPR